MKFHILTYSTESHNENLNLLTNNLNVFMLPILTDWTWDFYPKSLSVQTTLKTLNDDDVVLVCDAHDVLPLSGLSNDILFDKIKDNFNLDKITFNAEKNCYPDINLIPQYPNVNSEWKYLNAGIYVGKVKNVLTMLENSLPKIKNNMDQNIFSILYVNSEFNIDIDYECKVFQTMFELNPEDLTIIDGKIYNNKTKTNPVLFHGNGKSNLNIVKNLLCS
jgi:hypothetical protein